ncbi:MAG TPA: hypothetical protein VMJ74_10435, partial [Pseudomonadales bacterium]|nr:hypothetical protein [Pseudomonadales bacterium]
MSTTTAKRALSGKRLNRRIGTFLFPLVQSKAGLHRSEFACGVYVSGVVGTVRDRDLFSGRFG